MKRIIVFCLISFTLLNINAQEWITFEGKKGAGNGKHIVLISGDEEYRSEESLPMLAKILAERHGFKCTVLFAIDPATGNINPEVNNNIPGLHFLESADLMLINTRWRKLPDDQMKYFDDYLLSGKPVLGLRTSNHGFKNETGNYVHYSSVYKKEDPNHPWYRGFGGLLFGDHYVKHHGRHKHESTKGIFAKNASEHEILRGIKDGEIWGPTDVYGCRVAHLPITPLVMGQVLKRAGEYDKNDRFFGMRPTDKPLEGPKNNPMIPVAWLKDYQHPDGGVKGLAFHTSMGSSTDLENAGLRRLVVNAAYYLLDLKIPKKGTNVNYIGAYKTTAYGFMGKAFWDDKGLKPADLK
ncbi:hypothetical protein QQ020_19750 [Fulvivirgaceae bacterium BMA12]|uniref:ThuA-like domain-containing protein n=1 Tax=Agaribacillus aureus TaxID=3051825 RepID=A0ABT8LDD1_9BACT|nr:hypothetical protein [Fulvivirgaceae bacterium BMA12]